MRNRKNYRSFIPPKDSKQEKKEDRFFLLCLMLYVVGMVVTFPLVFAGRLIRLETPFKID